MSMIMTCPTCGTRHPHPYYWCQECEARMNDNDGEYACVSIQTPIHFRRANEGSYTMSELRRDNDATFRHRDKIGS